MRVEAALSAVDAIVRSIAALTSIPEWVWWIQAAALAAAASSIKMSHYDDECELRAANLEPDWPPPADQHTSTSGTFALEHDNWPTRLNWESRQQQQQQQHQQGEMIMTMRGARAASVMEKVSEPECIGQLVLNVDFASTAPRKSPASDNARQQQANKRHKDFSANDNHLIEVSLCIKQQSMPSIGRRSRDDVREEEEEEGEEGEREEPEEGLQDEPQATRGGRNPINIDNDHDDDYNVDDNNNNHNNNKFQPPLIVWPKQEDKDNYEGADQCADNESVANNIRSTCDNIKWRPKRLDNCKRRSRREPEVVGRERKRRLVYERIDRFHLRIGRELLNAQDWSIQSAQNAALIMPFKNGTFDASFCFNLLNIRVTSLALLPATTTDTISATSAPAGGGCGDGNNMTNWQRQELERNWLRMERLTRELRLALLVELSRVVKSKGK